MATPLQAPPLWSHSQAVALPPSQTPSPHSQSQSEVASPHSPSSKSQLVIGFKPFDQSQTLYFTAKP